MGQTANGQFYPFTLRLLCARVPCMTPVQILNLMQQALEWHLIDSAPRDGRFIDSYNAHNGERRVTKWIGANHVDVQFGIASPWAGWDNQWGNQPTHWLPLPMMETLK